MWDPVFLEFRVWLSQPLLLKFGPFNTIKITADSFLSIDLLISWVIVAALVKLSEMSSLPGFKTDTGPHKDRCTGMHTHTHSVFPVCHGEQSVSLFCLSGGNRKWELSSSVYSDTVLPCVCMCVCRGVVLLSLWGPVSVLNHCSDGHCCIALWRQFDQSYVWKDCLKVQIWF